MPRKKCAENCVLPFWASGNQSCRDGRFIQIGNSLYFHKEFQSLKPSTQIVYERMMMESGGRAEFTFPKRTAKKYGLNYKTVLKAISELKARGFITETCCGRYTRTPNEYKFTSVWKDNGAG